MQLVSTRGAGNLLVTSALVVILQAALGSAREVMRDRGRVEGSYAGMLAGVWRAVSIRLMTERIGHLFEFFGGS